MGGAGGWGRDNFLAALPCVRFIYILVDLRAEGGYRYRLSPPVLAPFCEDVRCPGSEYQVIVSTLGDFRKLKTLFKHAATLLS